MREFVGGLTAEVRGIPCLIRRASGEMKKLSSLTGASMLAALNVVLHQFTIVISQLSQISFTFLATGLSAMLYGPVVTGMIGVATDLIKYMVRPNGGFFPGFTLNEFLIGFLFGLFFYQKKITIQRVFVAQLTVTIVVDMLLTPLWLSMMYGQAFIVLVSVRIVKNLLLLAVKVPLLYVLTKKISELKARRAI